MELFLHPTAQAQVEALASQPRGTILLHGDRGVGKRTIALEVARRLNCLGCTDRSCRSCRMVAGGNHPNITLVEPDDKGKIGVEAVQQLQHGLRFQQYDPAGARVIIIVGSDRVTLPAQNALLKTLEEPPVGSLVILTAQAPQALLPTVLSRCRQVFIPRLSTQMVLAFLTQRYPQADAETIATQSHGLIGRAASLATDPEQLVRVQATAEAAYRLLHESSLLMRLQTAVRAAGETDNREELIAELVRRARSLARQGSHRGTQALMALERLEQRLAAHVAPKTAFEAMAVELS